jgi:hypothetical protein
VRLLTSSLVLAVSVVSLPAGATEPLPAPAPLPAVPATPDPGRPVPYPAPSYDDLAPPWWALPPRVTERNSKGLWATGITLWGVSAVLTAVGAALAVQEASQSCVFDDESPPPPGGERAAHRPLSGAGRGEPLGTARQALDGCGQPDTGLAVLAAAFVVGGAAIPLFLVGNKRVVKKPPGSTPDSAIPALRIGSSGAALRWTF